MPLHVVTHAFMRDSRAGLGRVDRASAKHVHGSNQYLVLATASTIAVAWSYRHRRVPEPKLLGSVGLANRLPVSKDAGRNRVRYAQVRGDMSEGDG